MKEFTGVISTKSNRSLTGQQHQATNSASGLHDVILPSGGNLEVIQNGNDYTIKSGIADVGGVTCQFLETTLTSTNANDDVWVFIEVGLSGNGYAKLVLVNANPGSYTFSSGNDLNYSRVGVRRFLLASKIGGVFKLGKREMRIGISNHDTTFSEDNFIYFLNEENREKKTYLQEKYTDWSTRASDRPITRNNLVVEAEIYNQDGSSKFVDKVKPSNLPQNADALNVLGWKGAQYLELGQTLNINTYGLPLGAYRRIVLKFTDFNSDTMTANNFDTKEVCIYNVEDAAFGGDTLDFTTHIEAIGTGDGLFVNKRFQFDSITNTLIGDTTPNVANSRDCVVREVWLYTY